MTTTGTADDGPDDVSDAHPNTVPDAGPTDGPDAGPNDLSDVGPGARPDVVRQVFPDVGRNDESRHDPDHASPTAPGPRPIAELPTAVRQRVVQWAADTLSGAAAGEIPPALARVARFAPAKRARLAATALGQAVQSDGAFRALVAERATDSMPTDPAHIDVGRAEPAQAEPALPEPALPEPALPEPALPEPALPEPIPTDPIAAAARAYLLRLPEEEELLRAAAQIVRRNDGRARVVELEREVRTLTARLERSATRTRRSSPDRHPDVGDEAERLRLRLREQGNRIRELQRQVDTGAAEAASALAAVTAERDRARGEAELWRQRSEAASARADSAGLVLQRLRDSAGDRRAAADRRLELLLGALEGAAAGLRREWELVGGGPAPADVVAARLPTPLSDAGRTADPSRLTAWAGLPGAHLIVDGYNVTKTGFPELSLSDQRDRLVRAVAALASRTSAEVTVVFDGAAVTTARPPGRGIRVLFSPPGVLADDVIRDLVRAEPLGRVIIVVSSDRQVVDRATADGARTAPSAVLLAALGN